MSEQFDDDLTSLQGIQLIQESDSAKHLLAYGIRALPHRQRGGNSSHGEIPQLDRRDTYE